MKIECFIELLVDYLQEMLTNGPHGQDHSNFSSVDLFWDRSEPGERFAKITCK